MSQKADKEERARFDKGLSATNDPGPTPPNQEPSTDREDEAVERDKQQTGTHWYRLSPREARKKR
jgi:hypothetical protein